MPHHPTNEDKLAAAEAVLHNAMKAYAEAAAQVHEDEGQEPFFAKQLGVQEVVLEATAFLASEVASEGHFSGERLDAAQVPDQIMSIVRAAHNNVADAVQRELPEMLWAIGVSAEHSAN